MEWVLFWGGGGSDSRKTKPPRLVHKCTPFTYLHKKFRSRCSAIQGGGLPPSRPPVMFFILILGFTPAPVHGFFLFGAGWRGVGVEGHHQAEEAWVGGPGKGVAPIRRRPMRFQFRKGLQEGVPHQNPNHGGYLLAPWVISKHAVPPVFAQPGSQVLIFFVLLVLVSFGAPIRKYKPPTPLE